MNFLSCRTSIPEENRVGKTHEGPTSYLGVARGWSRQVACGHLVGPLGYFLFLYFFSNIPKWTENIFMEFSELVYLPYHIPTLFQGSGVFRKVSLMCSSGVMV